MIKKEFIDSLKRIKVIIDNIDGVHKALKKLDPDFGGFYLANVETEMLHLLKIAINDDSDWISYFVYDLEWGKKWKKGMITSRDGKDIPLKTINDVYNIMHHKDYK